MGHFGPGPALARGHSLPPHLCWGRHTGGGGFGEGVPADQFSQELCALPDTALACTAPWATPPPGVAPPSPGAEKAAASYSCFLLLPLPPPLSWSQAASQWLAGPTAHLSPGPLGGWVGSRSCVLSFALIPHLSSHCLALLITDSSVSEALPPSLPARLSPYFCSSVSVLASCLQLPHFFPFSPLHPQVCVG